MSDRAKVYWDTRLNQANEISSFIHCSKCVVEVQREEEESPASYARLNVGITPEGSVQIWCERHNVNVGIMAFQPRPGLEY